MDCEPSHYTVRKEHSGVDCLKLTKESLVNSRMVRFIRVKYVEWM